MRPLLKCGLWGSMLVAVALLLGLVALGCDDLGTTDGGTDATVGPATTGAADATTSSEIPVSSTDPPDSTTTTAAAPPATTPSTVSSAEEVLSSGLIRVMGFIDDVWEDGSGRHLRIDYADMLTGAEADAAAVAAGAIPPGEHADNDYWISNVNPTMREWDISDSVAILTSTRWVPPDDVDDMNQPCSWADFLSFWGSGPFPESEGHLHEVPWWIFRDGSTIVKIEEQYLP